MTQPEESVRTVAEGGRVPWPQWRLSLAAGAVPGRGQRWAALGECGGKSVREMGECSIDSYRERTAYCFLFFHGGVTWNVVSLTCPLPHPFPLSYKTVYSENSSHDC